MQPESDYQFTNNWFDGNRAVWDQLINQLKPERILEIGSYEGKSTAYLIETLAAKDNLEIHCIDTWEGGIEHKQGGSASVNMTDVESRFHHNIKTAKSNALKNNANSKTAVTVHKGESRLELANLIAKGLQGSFDFVYVDGSHQAPDVLLDSVLGFELLRINGIIAFDDYLWAEPLPGGQDPIRSPKIAIDAFTNIYCRKLRIIQAPLYQLYAQKIKN